MVIATTALLISCATNGLPAYDERPYNHPMTLVKAASPDYVINDYESFALYEAPLLVDESDLGNVRMGDGYARLYRTKDATYLSLDYYTPENKWFYCFNSGKRIIDEETGDEYWIRSVENLPFDTCCFILGAKGRCVRFILEYPPLPKRVKKISFFTPGGPSRDTFDGSATRYGPFEVEKMRKKRAPGSSIKPRIIE